MKTTIKYIRLLCLMLCLAFILVACNETANPSAEVSNSSVSEGKSEQENLSIEEYTQSEPDYQAEMTEEMAREFLKFKGVKYSFEELLSAVTTKGYNYKNDYTAFGNLNGYTLCYVSPYFLESTAPQGGASFIAGEYVFISPNVTGDPSKVCLYLYKDMSFITIEDAYELGLFNSDEAYELMKKNSHFKETSLKKLSDLPDDEAEMYRQNARR